MEPIRLEIFLDDKTAAGIGSASKGLKGMEQVGNLALQSLQAQTEALRAKIEQLNAQGIDTTAERAQLEELKKSSAALTAELEKLRKAKVQNNETPTVKDDPAPKLNNLRMSFTQIARELPSLTMGPQMFFLAISNNIPMVQDALAQARKEHDALVASGKKATPVWRQVVSSLVSWQTALAVGITLLVMYGKDIWDFTKSLFGVKEAAVEAMRSSDEFRDSVVDSSSDVIAKLMELSAEYTALGQNIDAQNQFIANNQNRFEELGLSISNVQEAENALIGNTDKVIQAMLARAQAAAASETMQEELKKAMELRREWEETDAKMTYTTYSGIPFQGGKWETITTDNPEKDKARKAYDNQMARIRDLVKFQQSQKKLADGILESIGLGGSGKNDPEAGSIAGLDAEIRLKKKLQQATKTKEEYQKIQKEIDALEEKKISITGSSQKKKTIKQQKEYDPTEDRLKLMRENQQKEIDLMAEGNEKKRAQLALDYQKQLDDIKELEKKLSEASGGKLNDNDLEQIRKAYGMADNEYLQGMAAIDQEEQDEKQKHLDELLKKYQDYEARRKALQEQTDKDIRDLQEKRNTDNADAIDAAIEEARKQLREGLEAINSEEASQASKDSPFLRNLFGDYSEMAYQDLKNLIAQARQLQDYLNGTGSKEGITFIAPDQLAAIEQSPDDLDRLRKALKQLLQEGEKGDTWTQLLQRFKKGLEDLKNADDYKDYAAGISEISAVAGEAAGALAEMAENMGAGGLADALGTLQTAMSSISAIGNGFAQGGIIGGAMAIIGETARLFAKGAAEERKHQDALEALMAQRLAQQRAYNLLLMEQNLEYERANAIFGTNSYGMAINAVNVYKQAIEGLDTALKGDGEYYYRNPFGKYRDIKKYGFDYIRHMNDYAGLANVQIKNGSYTTGAWFWKKQHDKYDSVLEVYPELIDAQGNFNKELAQTILDTREMSGESRAALQNFVDLAEKQEEALQVMKDYLTNVFGELGGVLSDALTDAFRNGTDAAEKFEKSVVSMLEKLAQQMAYSVTLAPIFEEATDKMLEVMKTQGLTPEEQFKKYTDIIADTMDQGLAAQDDFYRLLEAAKQAAAGKGLDLFQPDDSSGSSQSASVGGYAALTQEQGTKLEGLFTGVYDRMVSIHGLMVSLQKDRQADSRLLAQIAENTAYCRYLLSIYEMMERMDREGITVR